MMAIIHNGISRRSYQYSRGAILRDVTLTSFWDGDRSMIQSELKGKTLQFYCIHAADVQQLVCGISLDAAPIQCTRARTFKDGTR